MIPKSGVIVDVPVPSFMLCPNDENCMVARHENELFTDRLAKLCIEYRRRGQVCLQHMEVVRGLIYLICERDEAEYDRRLERWNNYVDQKVGYRRTYASEAVVILERAYLERHDPWALLKDWDEAGRRLPHE